MTNDGAYHSLLLQNAETVRLIGPAETAADDSSSKTTQQSGESSVDGADVLSKYQAVSVTELKVGQAVYLHLQGAARHTGISINETIIEK